ncbi:MAG TPA: hypothetical protein VIK41_01360 [Gemmatimonadaceae bacterium]
MFRVVVRVGLLWFVSLLVAFVSMEAMHRILVASGRVVDPAAAALRHDGVLTDATGPAAHHAPEARPRLRP